MRLSLLMVPVLILALSEVAFATHVPPNTTYTTSNGTVIRTDSQGSCDVDESSGMDVITSSYHCSIWAMGSTSVDITAPTGTPAVSACVAQGCNWVELNGSGFYGRLRGNGSIMVVNGTQNDIAHANSEPGSETLCNATDPGNTINLDNQPRSFPPGRVVTRRKE
jgi:hypothetical protein